MEVAPMEPPKPLVTRFEKPKDPRELAETLAIGALLVDSKKSRREKTGLCKRGLLRGKLTYGSYLFIFYRILILR